MAVSVTMPRLGESVSEGTVTRWLKQEGEQVAADEPLLEVSTDKVDTEIPAPASGVLQSIKVAEDETVDIGVELAIIGDGAQPADADATPSGGSEAGPSSASDAPAADAPTADAATADAPVSDAGSNGPVLTDPVADVVADTAVEQQPGDSDAPAQTAGDIAPADGTQAESAPTPPAASQPAPQPPQQAVGQPAAQQAAQASEDRTPSTTAADEEDEPAGAYVTPLVRKLASQHNVDLSSVQGSGVGGRIRKSDVLAAAEKATGTTSAAPAAAIDSGAVPTAPTPATAPAPAAPTAPTAIPESAIAAQQALQPTQPSAAAPTPAPAATSAPASTPPTAPPAPTAPTAPTSQPEPAATPAAGAARGRTEKLSRRRALIAARMIESLQTSAQLTTVVEVDVTRIARLRATAKAAFEAREGVKLTFLPFFALATVEALRVHPGINASIDTAAGTVTYHDAVNLGIAVDTDSGLVVPVIQSAGDLNLGGLARKIADLAARTRTNKIGPDELSGATFSITNTGSRGALFDTPIFTPPQVAILGTGAVVKRAVVVSDPDIGETIAVRSMLYLALSYDHQIVDGADAARFLGTIKERLEAGAFENALGLG